MKFKPKTLNLLLSDPVTEIATSKVVEIINILKNKNTPTILYEFNSYETWNKLQKKTYLKIPIYILVISHI